MELTNELGAARHDVFSAESLAAELSASAMERATQVRLLQQKIRQLERVTFLFDPGMSINWLGCACGDRESMAGECFAGSSSSFSAPVEVQLFRTLAVWQKWCFGARRGGLWSRSSFLGINQADRHC